MRQFKHRGRVRRLVLTAVAMVLTSAGLAVATTSAQAGEAGANNRLSAIITNDSPYPLVYVEGWSQYGFNVAPTSVPVEDSRPFEINGSIAPPDGYVCYYHRNFYNGWWTYKVDSVSETEYVTISIYGERLFSGNGGCTGNSQPAVDVFYTSTPPPATWNRSLGAPPDVKADPILSYQHNSPTLFDQTFDLDHESPELGVPTLVSLGDSTISGEAGRWAGNTNTIYYDRIDAGAHSYWDAADGESIPGCHRSQSAEVHIGHGVRTMNFACSAAETVSYYWFYEGSGFRWKPGVDWQCPIKTDYIAGDPNAGTLGCPGPKPGQVQMLHDYAMNHNVKAVLLAVGANDFDFSGILQDCMEHYVETRLVHPTGGALCSQGAAFQNAISPANKLAIESKIVGALVGIQAAMTDAGYTRDDYTVILQNYWSAIPEDAALRIPDVDLKRLEQGGCPLMDGDATALNTQLLKAINDTVFAAATRFRDNAGASTPPLKLLDVRDALVGHRLCERGVDLIERASPDGSQKGTSPTMVDKVEWVAEARSESVLGTPYTLAEGGHANYWGQLAERNCVRQLFDDIISPDVNRPNNPLRNGGRCMHGSGVNLYGEPTMYLGGLGPYRW